MVILNSLIKIMRNLACYANYFLCHNLEDTAQEAIVTSSSEKVFFGAPKIVLMTPVVIIRTYRGPDIPPQPW